MLVVTVSPPLPIKKTSATMTTTNTATVIPITQPSQPVSPMDDVTPQESLTRALNYNEPILGDVVTANGTPTAVRTGLSSNPKIKEFEMGVVQKINNCKYLYPSVAILLISLLVLIIMFQNISVFVKLICIVMALCFLILTMVQYRYI